MISASLSLSLPRLGWKSTSTPRSLNICTAAGDSASEMRTFGFVMGVFLDPPLEGEGRREAPGWGESCGLRKFRVRRAGRISPHPAAPFGASTLPLQGRVKKSRRLQKLRPGLGESPVDPLGEQRNIARLDCGATPDAQTRRRIAMAREVVTGAFLLNQTDHLL